MISTATTTLALLSSRLAISSAQPKDTFLHSNKLATWAGAAKRFFTLSTGLAFWIWQPIHSSIQSLLAPAVFIYPRPFTSCVAIKCLDRRLNSSFQLYSRPMRPIPNHNSLRGRSQFTAWPLRPILNHNSHRAGAF